MIEVREMSGFQSAPPVKGATVRNDLTRATEEFQSAPPVKGATHTTIERGPVI